MINRIISLVLFFAILVSGLPVMETTTVQEDDSLSVEIQYDDESADQLTVYENSKEVITAICEFDDADYQWQIQVPNAAELWVDIQGQTDAELSVSYPLVESLLDDNDCAAIRCVVSTDEDRAVSSEVRITALSGSYQTEETDAVEKTATTAEGELLENTEYTEESLNMTVMQSEVMLAAEEIEYVTVTINYRDAEDGSALFGSYTARILKGIRFSETVLSPTWLGFTPVYHQGDRGAEWNEHDWDGNEDADIIAAQSITFNETVNEDITINVYYIPALVPYAVQYFMQNLNDDLYTENHSLYWTGTTLTGTIIQDSVLMDRVKDDTIGFSMLYHIPASVAADGSTKFVCYLDRNYYLVQFDLDGGYGQEPIYARYEAPIIPTNPTKPGYSFSGWEVYCDLNVNGKADNGEEMIDQPATVPAYNLLFKAVWVKSANPDVTYVYWLQNADNDEYSYWESVVANTLAAGEMASGAAWLEDTSEAVVKIDGSYYTTADKSAETLYALTNNSSSSDSETTYFEYAEYTVYNEEKTEAEEPCTVLGNGSAVVNIYYDRKDYTLRFYFAKEVSGKIYVSSSTQKSLQDSFASGRYAEITGNMDMSADSNGTAAKKRVDGTTTYYYFDLTARFGSDISDRWPATGFLGDATELDWRYESGGGGMQFLTWGTNYATSYYTNNNNKNIKGIYSVLDAALIESSDWDGDDEDIDGDGITDSVTGFYAYNKSWSYKYVFEYMMLDKTTGNYVLKKVEPVKVTATPSDMVCSAVTGYDYKSKTYLKYDSGTNSWKASDGSATSVTGTYNVEMDDGTNITIDGVNCVVRFKFEPKLYRLSFYSHGSFASLPIYYGQTVKERLGTLGYIQSNANNGDSAENVYYSDLADMANFYPAGLEPNAYTFGGWYSNQIYTSDSKIDLSAVTMPARNAQLYACWLPVTCTVEFYYDYSELKNGNIMEANGQKLMYTVEHGSSLGDSGCTVGDLDDQTFTDSNGTKFTLYFNGWFYMDNDVKTAINLESTQIKKDMKIYADWTSEVPQPYLILYKEHASDTEVAEPLKGYGYQGTTRTFTAKVGSSAEGANDGQLYDDYNVGWFPIVSSHSIIMNAEDDINNPSLNVYTFEYVHLEAPIEYTVRYVNKLDGTTLYSREETLTTRYSLVTERFIAIEGYVPDAFYKQLVLSVEWNDADGDGIQDDDEWVSGAQNVITFYYTPSETTAFYAVHYMMQTVESVKSGGAPTFSIDSSDFAEGSHVEAVADIGAGFQVTPLSFVGFTRASVPALSTTNGGQTVGNIEESGGVYTISVTENGTELYIFYERNTYSYKIELRKYYAEGDDNDLLGSIIIGDDEEETKSVFGDTVFASHSRIEELLEDSTTKWSKTPDLGIYVPVNGAEQKESITIRADEADPQNNIIVIYYTLRNYTIEYIAGVGGETSRTRVTITPDSTDFSSTAMAYPGYKFAGWYTDAEYSNPVVIKTREASASAETLAPNLNSLEPSPAINRFYAKFEEQLGTLTITRRDADDDQTFVYKVVSIDYPSVCIYVSVSGNDSVSIINLRQGNYTVTQENGWSWRYEDDSVDVILTDEATVIFAKEDFETIKNKWLSRCAEIVFGKRKEND